MILVLIFLSMFSLSEQPEPDFSAELVQKEGKNYVSVVCELPEGFHIYSHYMENPIGPVPTSLHFDSTQFNVLEDLKEEGKMIDKFDRNFQQTVKYFEDKVVFTQEVEVLNDGDKWVEIEYMLCNETTCYPPKKVKLSIKL